VAISDWSESIVLVELGDEPALSEDLEGVIARLADRAADAPDLVLNFAGVTYLNSSNIAQLLRLRTLLSRRTARLRLCAVTDSVWSILLVTGLDQIFEFAADVMTAIASLQVEDGA